MDRLRAALLGGFVVALASAISPRELRGSNGDARTGVDANATALEESLLLNRSASEVARHIGHARADECYEPERGWAEVSKRHELIPGAKVIVEVGGNTGQDLYEYTRRFPDAKIFAFEPVPEFYAKLKEKFGNNPNVFLSDVALSDKDGTTEFVVSGVSSGGLNKSTTGHKIQVQLRDADAVLQEIWHKVGSAPDVVSLNCEGCEYAVLQRLVDKGWISHGWVPFMQVSWHTPDALPDRKGKRCRIEHALRHASKDGGYYWLSWWEHMYGWQGWRYHKR
eukprot:gnl/TRDRNA2_/TRDRNA2_35129_c0_seq1.p1 gnl/TRDRNA2_/TRDRNA2_35129_c0~~gnl/TRDRNA2_/TRDRNA2_35129_c0_seq1.p1  ORF type:complete len:280 (-),score=50.39 gnl/TRDRNA2_/TRDRNA2_35129_c0_seq1:176-1015(-)